MAMEHPPFEDVVQIENQVFPASHVSFRECDVSVGSLELVRITSYLGKSYRKSMHTHMFKKQTGSFWMIA